MGVVPRHRSQVQQLNQHGDTLLGLYHIKRVKPSDVKGQLLVLLCVLDRSAPSTAGACAHVAAHTHTRADNAPPLLQDLPRALHDLTAPLAHGLTWAQVPRHPPTTKSLSAAWSQHWPVSLKVLPPPPPASILSAQEAETALYVLQTLHSTCRETGCVNAACIVDPATGLSLVCMYKYMLETTCQARWWVRAWTTHPTRCATRSWWQSTQLLRGAASSGSKPHRQTQVNHHTRAYMDVVGL